MLILFWTDRFLVRFFMTRMQDVEIHRGETGVLLRFKWHNKMSILAPKIQVAGSIVRLCIPAINNAQYHPFSGSHENTKSEICRSRLVVVVTVQFASAFIPAFYDPYDVRYACIYMHNAGDW